MQMMMQFLKFHVQIGPLLFVIYKNDIANVNKLFDFIIYLDDMRLSTTIDIVMNETYNIIVNQIYNEWNSKCDEIEDCVNVLKRDD